MLEIQDWNYNDGGNVVHGVVNGDYPGYAHIPWDLGIIRNYDDRMNPVREDINTVSFLQETLK